eukprot:6173884-Pleurochrysis_carterae.AAC.1
MLWAEDELRQQGAGGEIEILVQIASSGGPAISNVAENVAIRRQDGRQLPPRGEQQRAQGSHQQRKYLHKCIVMYLHIPPTLQPLFTQFAKALKDAKIYRLLPGLQPLDTRNNKKTRPRTLQTTRVRATTSLDWTTARKTRRREVHPSRAHTPSRLYATILLSIGVAPPLWALPLRPPTPLYLPPLSFDSQNFCHSASV